MEFHITRKARDTYQFDESLFSLDGNVLFANFQAARDFAHKINLKRAEIPVPYVSAAQINALGLMDEIFHLIIAQYFQKNGEGLRNELYHFLQSRIGKNALQSSLLSYNELFPPVAVYRGEQDSKAYFRSSNDGIPNQQRVLEEMLLTGISNENPAASPYKMLFDDRNLRESSAYPAIIDAIGEFFKNQPGFGPGQLDLVSLLRSPARHAPHSLSAQLEYIRMAWGEYLGEALQRLLGSLGQIAEENKALQLAANRGGPGPMQVPDYHSNHDGSPFGEYSEDENYSNDSDWMPRVVMIAKNSFVWLNQLSKQYGRDISRLDQIPDDTLDQLAQAGFTGLWLIGLWERSAASQRIKQMCGNPDAVASAYSLSRYQIAAALGGQEAWQNLSQRCSTRGIRLASDMVPNHMAIDSDWVYEHPEWFVSTPQSPFPSYSFNGPDLSTNPRVSIQLEDHYYDRTDASVVFKRYDHHTGQSSFVYHGNDGTNMPWNDTAQLNYLNPEVRESIIQTILSVARQFPIIRFDAAMTLTKKHYQRLWYPRPGSGADIPSRTDYAMSNEQFNQAMPEEFWRQVVDRVAREVPDTLLLAEAFWLMEGYFVRSLGMHRVYNSAFMHMLRNEDNDKYHQLLENTLSYDPEILKRYVNFMNNPDEKTAVEQFGKGEKYFGICTLLATLPGLPMFGHGQIEGYAEKYGMEYYRPYWDENPDQGLINEHRRSIFPLLHRRKLFAEVKDFRLYPFLTDSGQEDRNVFAYSNAKNGQTALVLYNNRFGSTQGRIQVSVPYLRKDNEHLQSMSLANGLQLNHRSEEFVLFNDYVSGLQHIYPLDKLRHEGMLFSLQAYSRHVFLDFQAVSGEQYRKLYELIGESGVPSIQESLHEISLMPLMSKLQQLFSNDRLARLLSLSDDPATSREEAEAFQEDVFRLLQEAGTIAGQVLPLAPLDEERDSHEFKSLLHALQLLVSATPPGSLSALASTRKLAENIASSLQADPKRQYLLLFWILLSELRGSQTGIQSTQQNRQICRESTVNKLLVHALSNCGLDEFNARLYLTLVQSMLTPPLESERATLTTWQVADYAFSDPDLRAFLQVNEYEDVQWFNKEAFENFISFYQMISLIKSLARPEMDDISLVEEVLAQKALSEALLEACKNSEFKVQQFLQALEE